MTPASAGAVGAVRSGEPAPTLKVWDAHPGPFPSREERSDVRNHPRSHAQPINGEHHNGLGADHGHGTGPSRVEAANGRGASRDRRLPGILHCCDRAESAVEPADPPTQRIRVGAAELAPDRRLSRLRAVLRRGARRAATAYQNGRGRAGLAILAYCVLATIGVAIFVTDPLRNTPATVSTHGGLHVVFGASALVLLPVAALLLNRSLARTHPHGYPSRRALNRIAFLPLTGFALIWIPEVSGLIPVHGWPNRILFLTYTAWVIIATTPLARSTSDR
jgi:hypothetical protein